MVDGCLEPEARRSSHMHERTLLRISNVLTENFMRDRRNIAFPEKKKAKHLFDRILFRPAEVYVRRIAGYVTQINQNSSDCIGNGRAARTQDFIWTYADSGDLQRSLKLRRIRALNFQKEQLLVPAEIVR